MVGEGQHHRRIVPADERSRRIAGDRAVEQGAQCFRLLMPAEAGGEVRGEDGDAGTVADMGVQRRTWRIVDRLFPNDDLPVPGEAAHQMLRPLIDEVPAQVTEADERAAALRRAVGVDGVDVAWNAAHVWNLAE